jgi:diguanylate cyclase (GGDEF)-like protein
VTARPTLDAPEMSAQRASLRGALGRLAASHRKAWTASTILFVALGSAGALLGARSVAHTDYARGRLAFHLASDEVASTLQLALQHEEDLVVSASAFISANPGASAAGFDRWVESVRAMRRYPELRNIGLVELVRADELRAFEARMAAHPLLALGPRTRGPAETFQVLPPGRRPYYCFAVAGLARTLSTYLPTGIDYCALAASLIASRDTGASSYAPVSVGSTTLGVQTPVYRGGVAPASVAARRAAFIGWLGELLEPEVVLHRALQGHPGVAAVFRYRSGGMDVAFESGAARPGAERAMLGLHNGWTVQTLGPRLSASVLVDRSAATLLSGGIVISALLGLLLFVLGTGRTRALSLVHEKTRELSHQALHDALTGLPNRALVLDRAEQLLARAASDPRVVAGALFVDIDGFKHVNDNLGHAAGDELLRIVSSRLRAAVREQDTVGRLGGDEFVVLVETQTPEEPIEVLADRLIETLRAPMQLSVEAKLLSFTASVGVAAGRYATPDGLLRDADLALYAAKAAGKDRYALFDASMKQNDAEGVELELELSAALWDGQLFLLFQPIVELATRRVVAAEALLRWRHPRRGIVSPGQFIPLAERSGLIVPIGRWVLHEACRSAAAWIAAGHEIGVSVNVSAQQLAHDEFTGEVRHALSESGIDPALLTLEVTETTIMRDVSAAGERLEEIRALGVRIALDDFGTGYASLSQLQRMPVDILKADRSFVTALAEGHGRSLLEAIFGVAQALSLSVIAEGIETPTQLDALIEMGCEMAQGYLLGRPASASDLQRDATHVPAETLDSPAG